MKPGHNYLKKIAELYRQGRFPSGMVGEAEVRHDDWCALLVQGGRCDCDPDIIVRLVNVADNNPAPG